MVRTALSSAVHPTAFVADTVRLGDGVTIGANCVVSGEVRIGDGTVLLPGTVIDGNTLIGRDCRIGPYAVVGADPQHRGYAGEPTWLQVDDNVIVREFATLHRATRQGIGRATRIENGVMLMAGAHVAHDCRVAAGAMLANYVQLGGHVTVGEKAFLGGSAVVHQGCRIGRLSIVAGNETVTKDVLPFGAVFHSRHKGYNVVGLRRAGLDPTITRAIREAFRVMHESASPLKAADRIATDSNAPDEVRELVEFMRTTHRGIQQYDLAS